MWLFGSSDKPMDKLTIRSYLPSDEPAVKKLWEACGLLVPWNNPSTDIARKHQNSTELFFVGEIDDALMATCMAGYDGHRGSIYYLAVDEKYRKQGHGTTLVHHAEKALREAGCPKINLMVRDTNQEVLSFYESIGYASAPVVVLGKRLIEDGPY